MRNGCHTGWFFVLLPACFHPSYDHPRCGPEGECPSGLTCSTELICEAPGGGTPDAALTCFGSFVKVCFTTLADVPTMPPMLPSDATIEIDTGASPMCDQHNDRNGEYCVVAGAGFTLAAGKSIRGYGAKPLVLLSTTTMMLEAASTVDVSSSKSGGAVNTGANANPSMCTSGTSATAVGGGYGGSFGGKGGNGEQVGATTGGTSADTLSPPPTALRGGCPGGDGANSGGAAGSGGGAVALIAGTSIQIDGNVNASGAGGRGGPATQSGGGGGGSGGMIVLDAPSITATGPLFANGGGGGQGGTGTGGGVGPGDDGSESSAPLTPALGGGNTARAGGFGGPGSAGTSRLTGGNGGNSPAFNSGGGGGGGGGAGFIRAQGVTMNIAPPSFAS